MISESGGAERVWSTAASAEVSKGFGEQWRKQSGNDLPSLKASPADALIQTQHRLLEDWPQHFPLRAEIDNSLLPRLPVQTIAAGATRGKRLLIGTNRDESALFVGPHPSRDATGKDLGNLSTEKFAQVFSRYRDIHPEMSAERLRIRALTAEEYWVPSIRVADAHLQGGGSAWMYRLDFAEAGGRLEGYAYHSLDVGLVWEHPHRDPANAAAEAALATQVHHAWAAFIRGEAPSAPGLPAWPQYSSGVRSTMVLDTRSRVEQKPQEVELRLWDGVL
jgi:para-nitrobenzyl esterase